MRTFRHLVSWVMALALIFLFLQATIHPLPNPPEGSVKFFDLPGENIVFQTLAVNSGYAIFEPTGRVITGFLELVTAFLLFMPFTRRFGAVMSSVILGGAVALHMSPWLGREVPTSLSDPNAAGDGGILFTLAVIMLVLSLLVLVVHPGRDMRS